MSIPLILVGFLEKWTKSANLGRTRNSVLVPNRGGTGTH